MGEGRYLHFGLKKELDCFIDRLSPKPQCVVLDIHVDGVNISDSSSVGLWTILCNVKPFEYLFPVGMYEGTGKPKDVDQFMQELLVEYSEMVNGDHASDVRIERGNFVMDAPARSLILDIKTGGYYACHKCWAKGIWEPELNTISYIGTGHRRRTHSEFVRKEQWIEADKRASHHVTGFQTAIEKIPSIDVVKHNPVDYMHSTCAGLMRRLLEYWLKKIPSFRDTVDALVDKMRLCWPEEFQRKIRSLKYFNNFKATELRAWLLYVAPAVMKLYLTPEQYQHFCLAHHGIRLLFLTPIPIESNLVLAEKCINEFLEQWPNFYPDSALAFVVHATEHLPDDCRQNKSTPDGFSAFPFENYLRRVKRNHHTGGKKLEQVNNSDTQFKTTFV